MKVLLHLIILVLVAQIKGLPQYWVNGPTGPTGPYGPYRYGRQRWGGLVGQEVGSFLNTVGQPLGGILGNFRPNVHIGGTQYTNIGSQIGNQYGRKKRSVFINQDGTTVGTQIGPDGSVFNNNIGANIGAIVQPEKLTTVVSVPGVITNSMKPNPIAMETNPMKTNPMETNLMKTNPMETNPMKPNPMKTNPMETNPMETNPKETNPLQKKVKPLPYLPIVYGKPLGENYWVKIEEHPAPQAKLVTNPTAEEVNSANEPQLMPTGETVLTVHERIVNNNGAQILSQTFTPVNVKKNTKEPVVVNTMINKIPHVASNIVTAETPSTVNNNGAQILSQIITPGTLKQNNKKPVVNTMINNMPHVAQNIVTAAIPSNLNNNGAQILSQIITPSGVMSQEMPGSTMGNGMNGMIMTQISPNFSPPNFVAPATPALNVMHMPGMGATMGNGIISMNGMTMIIPPYPFRRSTGRFTNIGYGGFGGFGGFGGGYGGGQFNNMGSQIGTQRGSGYFKNMHRQIGSQIG